MATAAGLRARTRSIAGRASAASLLAAALVGCAEQEARVPADPVAKLYARGLGEISDLYIEPVSTRQLAIAGTSRLARLDPKISIAESESSGGHATLTLDYEGREVASFPAPSEGDAPDWGELIAKIIDAAKGISPAVAHASPETINATVFDGITSMLDGYSRYAGPSAARDQRAARDGFGGVGVTFDAGEQYRIVEVTAQSPADRAGIRPGDAIVAVNGAAVAGRSQADVIHLLRGPLFTQITITIARPGVAGTRDFRLERGLVVVPTVTVTRDGNIAVFRIASFNQSTTQILAQQLDDAQGRQAQRLGGIVLDLRGNPGGLLDQAVSIADLFVRSGPIVSTTGRHPASRQYFAASGDGIAPQIPIAVLINGGSASASEIVAAALQDLGRAVILGSSSYGKGSVQTVLRLPNDGELTLTWARLVTPAGYLLQRHGVVPTLCTAGLGDDAAGLETAVQRVAAGVREARARSALDDRGWAELRQSCPPKPTSPAIDVKLAERLLADPKLYGAALHAIQPAPQLARAAAGASGGSVP